MLFNLDLQELKKTKQHFPVMLNDILNIISNNFDTNDNNLIFLDCTFGAGGYTEHILKYTKAKVIAFDRDEKTVIKYVNNLKNIYKERFTFVADKFSTYNNHLKVMGISKVDGIIMDLGFSNMQISSRDRGFSFFDQASLDMTMGKNQTTAFDVINYGSSELLSDIIYHYGEEKKARQITNRIIKIRQNKKIQTAVELANIVRGVVGFKKKKNESKIDPSTKTFQALRIYVNDELNELNIALENSIDVLNKNGILAIVSFHSLEDRIVKQFFSNNGVFIKENFNDSHNQKVQNSVFNILSKKPILPSEEEIHINPESRSAKLRASKRL